MRVMPRCGPGMYLPFDVFRRLCSSLHPQGYGFEINCTRTVQPGFIYDDIDPRAGPTPGPLYIVFKSKIADIANTNTVANDVHNPGTWTFSREPGILVNIMKALRYKEQSISNYTIENHVCTLYRRVVNYNVFFTNKRISLEVPSWQDDRVVRT